MLPGADSKSGPLSPLKFALKWKKIILCLARLEPVYEYIVLWNQALSTNFAPFCNSITRQLIALESYANPQKTLRVFAVWTEKNFFGFVFRVFRRCLYSWGTFLAIMVQVTWPWAQPLDGSISLKFLLVTKLKPEFFELLIGFLAFLVQELV